MKHCLVIFFITKQMREIGCKITKAALHKVQKRAKIVIIKITRQ